MADKIMTIPKMLKYRAEHDKDIHVFTFYDRDGVVSTLNPHEIYTLAGKFAFWLKEWGFKQGDVIASGLPNSPERIVADMGVIMAGCMVSNFQVIEKDGADFWKTTHKSQCRALIVPKRKDDPTYQLISPYLPDNAKPGMHMVSIKQAPSVTKVVLCDRREDRDKTYSFLEFLKHRSDTETLEATCRPTGLAVLFSTSGSSGFSKLIPNSHVNVLESGRRFKAAEGALYFSDRAMGWIGGFPFEFLAFCGRRVTQDQFDDKQTSDPGPLWNILSTAGCTGAALLPGAVYELVDYFRNSPPEFKLQFITSTGQAIKTELMDAIGLLCHAVVVAYGSTEGGIFSADAITNVLDFEDFYCGKVLPDVQVRIVDEEGEDIPDGEEGEIYLKSDRLVKRYYNSDEFVSTTSMTSISLSEDIYTSDGWFRTGDRGILNDNSLYCHGRSGDVVSIGATLLYLSWPENILNKCPDIQNSSIIAIEEKNGNIKLCACVIPKLGRENLKEKEVVTYFSDAMMGFNRKFHLKLSHVFIMKKFPLLATGKIHKRELKQFVEETLREMSEQALLTDGRMSYSSL